MVRRVERDGLFTMTKFRLFLSWLFDALGWILLPVTVVSIFYPSLFPSTGAYGALIYFFLGLILVAIRALYWVMKRRVVYRYKRLGTEVVVETSNLLNKSSSVVIGVDSDYSTRVGIGSVSERTLHGQWLATLSANQKKVVVKQIRHISCESVHGKPLVIPVLLDGRFTYLVGYSEFDSDGCAGSSVTVLQQSLIELWHRVRQTGSNGPVAIALVGTGLSRLALSPVQSISLIVTTFLLAQKEKGVSEKLTVCIPEDTARLISFHKIKAYLQSLDF